MTEHTIDDSALVTFKLHQTLDGETWQFGCKSARRPESDWPDLLDAMGLWITTSDLVMQRTVLDQVTYSEWGTSGFVGYHQRASILTTHSFSSGNQLPPQCAVVASLLNTSMASISLKRRRGRIYFGQVPATFADGDGALTTAAIDAYTSALVSLHAALISVPSGLPVSGDLDGLCVVSAAEGVIMEANQFGVGHAVDTQRRRRRKRVEGISYTVVT